VLRWRNSSADKKLDQLNTATCSVHRTTCCTVGASPTICLVKHLAKGKAAFLVPPGAEDGSPPTHMLVSHGAATGAIHLHRLFVSPIIIEDATLNVLKMALPTAGLHLDAFKAFMNKNILVPATAGQPGIGEGNAEPSDPQHVTEIDIRDSAGQSLPYETLRSLEAATRHMPLANSTTVISGENRKEDCWQAVSPLYEILQQPSPTLEDAENALNLLYRLHAHGISNEWGGTRTSGAFKVEAFKQFATLWREVHWALVNTAAAHPVFRAVADAAGKLTSENATGGPKIPQTQTEKVALYHQPQPSQYMAAAPASAAADSSTKRPREEDPSANLWEQHWGKYRAKVQQGASLDFVGAGNGPDELYDGVYVGVRGQRG